jgi:hypothetical protein
MDPREILCGDGSVEVLFQSLLNDCHAGLAEAIKLFKRLMRQQEAPEFRVLVCPKLV